jgi:NADH-quinone oxidoreductase E subunit
MRFGVSASTEKRPVLTDDLKRLFEAVEIFETVEGLAQATAATGAGGTFTETALEIEGVKPRYPNSRSVLLPALHIAQRLYGSLSSEALEAVSAVLNVPKATVKGVASFYSMYQHKHAGRHLIQLCTNVSCMLFGAESLVDFLKRWYGLEPGGTTEDGRFSFVIMECIGACGNAPAMLVDDNFHYNLGRENLIETLERYR